MTATWKMPLLRYWNWAWIAGSRQMIRLLAIRNKNILLVPTRPRGCGGDVHEYYHFIFDLVLPVYHILKRTPDDVEFKVEDFGRNSERLQQLLPNRIEIISSKAASVHPKRAKLVGMNPRGMARRSRVYDDFVKEVQSNVGIASRKNADLVLLIERMPPPAGSDEHGASSRTGTVRRSILNHGELARALESLVLKPMRFLNVRLEELSLVRQVELFAQAAVVVAQHGAGLANCIWMAPGSVVVELNNADDISHFNLISQAKGHRYLMYRTDALHAQIDIGDFVDWISANRCLPSSAGPPSEDSAR